jgi:hypothetical protein
MTKVNQCMSRELKSGRCQDQTQYSRLKEVGIDIDTVTVVRHDTPSMIADCLIMDWHSVRRLKVPSLAARELDGATEIVGVGDKAGRVKVRRLDLKHTQPSDGGKSQSPSWDMEKCPVLIRTWP